MKKGYFIYFFLLCLCIGNAQVKKEYSIVGLYKKKTAQGLAIYKHSAFLLNDGGYCRIYDLKKKHLTAEFDLASSNAKNHANCASFGISYPKGNKKYPALYISECAGECRCFVESINEKGSRLIQTIKFETVKNNYYVLDWIIDNKQKCIYTINRANLSLNDVDSIDSKVHLITKFPLPPLDSTYVLFTEKDILDQFKILFPNMLQGGTIRNNYLYLPVGVHDYPGSENRKDKHRAIIIVNLTTKQIERTIDINDSVLDEPEDIDFYKNELLLYCGQEGGLYRIPVDE